MIVDGKERPEVSNPDLGKFFFKDVFKVEEYVKKGITKSNVNFITVIKKLKEWKALGRGI